MDTEVAPHMSRPARTLLATVAAALLALALAPAALASSATHIVQLRPGVGLAEGARAVRAAGGEPAARLPLIGGARRRG